MHCRSVQIWGDSIAKGVVYDTARGRYTILKESAVSLLSQEHGIAITNQFGSQITIPCDAVIEAYDLVPNTALYDELKDTYETIAVGDCKAPWNIADAIIYGNLAGRAL